MPLEPEELQRIPAVVAFAGELRRWRESGGCSQKTLAAVVGYTPSYVSKVERGTLLASRAFAEAADQHLHAGRALIRSWREMHDAVAELPGGRVRHEEQDADVQARHAVPDPHRRRQVPRRPRALQPALRADPLTWEEIGLAASCGDESMSGTVKEDRDAFKEVWLQFENEDGRFPLYPGETAWISYAYSVRGHKWGPWWARAIRLPTRRLSMTLTFPARLQPVVWGIATSMTAEAMPFQTPISRQAVADDLVFSWSTDDPPVHARYRIEWKLRVPDSEQTAEAQPVSPAETMRELGIVQEGDPVLAQVARPFDLPAEAEDARRVTSLLASMLERVGQAHDFSKGMGLAAPQIGIGRAAAMIRTPDGEAITLLNPRITAETAATDEQYEGCLSFFDVRGMVPRPLGIEVEHRDVDGTIRITTFEQGMARLVCHEIDHLFGALYRSRMRPGVEPIPVSQYRRTGQQWSYR